MRLPNVTTNTKIILGLIFSLTVLVFVGVVSYFNMQNLVEATRERRQALEMRIELGALFADIIDAETAQRGYIITGQEEFLAPFNAALIDYTKRIEAVKRLANTPRLKSQIQTADMLFAQRLELMEQSIETYTTQGFAAAQALVRQGEGKALTDKIRGTVDTIDAEQEKAINEETAYIVRLQTMTTGTIAAGIAASVLIGPPIVYLIMRDLRARRKAELALAENESKLRTIIDTMGEGMVVANAKGEFTLFNRAAEQMLGAGMMAVSPDKWSEAYRNYLPDKTTPFPAKEFPLLRALKGEETHNVEIYVKRAVPLDPIFIIVSGTPIRDAENNIIGSIAVFSDITKQKEIEEHLYAEKTKAETTLGSIGDGVFALDVDNRITLFNRAAEKITGYVEKDVLGRYYHDVLKFRDESGQEVLDGFIATAQAGKVTSMSNPTMLIDKHGNLRPVADSAAPIYNTDGKQQGIIVVFRDVTDQERFERNLRQSNERFEMAAEATNDVIFDLNLLDGTMLWSESIHSQYGYPKDEDTSTLEWWTSRIHPDDAMKINDEFDDVLQGRGRTWETEYRFKRANGLYAFVRSRAFVQRNDHGLPIRIISSMLDITKQKELDRAKDEFISLVSHQLRTPLTAIRLFTEMLVKGQVGALNEQQQDYVQKVDLSTQRMIKLVGDMLNVSRLELGRLKVDPKPTDLNELIASHIKEIEPVAAQKKVTITFNPGTGVHKANVDSLLYGQIIHNLLTNAIRYSKPGSGTVTVSLTATDDSYRLCIEDNGIGIPLEVQPRIFERFFRAENAVKAEGEGTGLGLYLIKLIVEASGGKVWFVSPEGKGTAFYVTIPLSGMVATDGEKTLS